MKNVGITSTLEEKVQKMTLKDYYKGLPEASYPKKEFLTAVSQKTGMSEAAVRTWVFYGMKPSKEEHRKILSEMTGIKEEDLWKD